MEGAETTEMQDILNTPAAQQKKSLFEEKVSEEVAEAEINSWLDRRKVYPHKREKYKANIKDLVEAVRFGNLVVLESGALEQRLLFPVKNDEGGTALDKLVYEPRVRTERINLALKGMDPDDADGRTLGYLYALTNQSKGMLGKLDPADKGLGSNIALFFM